MKNFIIVLLILKLNVVYSQCDIQLGILFSSAIPDTIKYSVSTKGFVNSNSPVIEIYLLNKSRCTLKVNNIMSTNIEFQMEKKGDNGFVADTLCFNQFGLLHLYEDSLKIICVNEKKLSLSLYFPPSCIYIYQSGEFRVKYLFNFIIDNVSQKLESPWFYFYLQQYK